ncbi:hypothetical protein TRAPUB_4387, partial [Trametes pubescens]
PETTYNLRQFDVRARLRKPVQTVALEPFADLTDKAAIDINSLALSADGLYLAAGRTDNWVDVYDARMLARGPLHAFAHEDSNKPDRRAMYGVVKTEWVCGAPYGVGLVSGGADGWPAIALGPVREGPQDAYLAELTPRQMRADAPGDPALDATRWQCRGRPQAVGPSSSRARPSASQRRCRRPAVRSRTLLIALGYPYLYELGVLEFLVLGNSLA